jgi:hypothetical protein
VVSDDFSRELAQGKLLRVIKVFDNDNSKAISCLGHQLNILNHLKNKQQEFEKEGIQIKNLTSFQAINIAHEEVLFTDSSDNIYHYPNGYSLIVSEYS